MEGESDLEQRLIEEVSARRCLFDKEDLNYKNKSEREKQWKEIGTVLSKQDFECLKLWTKLRQQYTAFLKKLRKPSGSGIGKKTFFRHEALMGFLKDIVDPQEKTLTNVEERSQRNEASVDEIVQKISEVGEDETNVEHTVTLPPSQPQLQRSQQKYGKRKLLDGFDKELLKLMKNDDDEYDTFAKMVATKLRRIGEVDKKEYFYLQKKILQDVMDKEELLIN